MLPLVVVGCTSKQSVSQCVKLTTASGVDVAYDGGHRRRFFLSKGWSLCRSNWENLKYINEQCRWGFARIDGQLMQLLWAIHTRFQRSINTKVIKPSNPFTNVCWISCFNNIFHAPQFWLHRQFLLPNSRNRNDGWWFPLVLLLPVCLNSKRLLSTSCNNQGQRSNQYFSLVLFPMLFEVRRIVCVERLNRPKAMSWNFILLIFINVCQVRWIVIVFPD